MRDFELLFDGLPLEKVHVVFAAYDACLVLLPMYVVYAERRNISPQNLIGLSVYYFDIQVQADKVSFPPGAHLKLAVEFIRYCLNKVPRWLPMTFRSHGFQQAGANAIQASAFTLAMAIMLVEECIKAGLNPDDFVYRLGHHHTLTMDILETIAKVRAYRRMWARITRERFGCRNPRSYKANCQLQTSTSSLTWQQPLNNIIRTSLETLAGVLAGGNSLWTSAYDEGFTIPTEESAILAIRTNQIIMEETGLASVVDPLAGSYCLEWLTSRMEEEVTKLLAEIEQKGIFQCWESGWFKREIERSAYEWRRKVDSGELPIIGLNKYAIPDEKPNIKLFEHDLQVEKIAVERVRSFREKRDNASVTSALAGLKEAAAACKQGKGGNLFLVVEEAARRGATLGELMGVLREVFGYSFY
jgi:methylmalonyl-CoA mutase N-terminal domain/subunit